MILSWFAAYGATLAVGLIVALIVAAIVLKLVRDRKKGKSSCGCNCAHCAMAGCCHKATDADEK